jgi:hypothetical protein
MDQFADRLARIGELSEDEVAQLEAELVAAFDAADSAGDVDLMQQLSDALDAVRAAKTVTPEAAVPEAAPVAAAAETPVVAEDQTPAAEPPVVPAQQVATEQQPQPQPEGAPVAPAAEAPAQQPVPGEPTAAPPPAATEPAAPAPAPTEQPAVVDGEQHPVVVDANGQPVPATEPVQQPDNNTPTEEGTQVAPDTQQQEEAVATADVVTQEDVPDANKPVPVMASAPYTITAGGDIPGVTSGQTLSDMDEVVEALTRKINSMRGVGGDGEYVVVASLRRDDDMVPEDKMLRKADPEGNSAKIRRFMQQNESRESMVAAGWCAPRTPLYDIPGIGSTDTPVADSLPSFGVDRGGIIWTEPPSLAGVITSMGAAAFTRWVPTNSAGSISLSGVFGSTATSPVDTKPCIDIACGVERSADLIAIPLCLCFDLLSSRTNPEFVKAATDLVQVAQAHFKEQYLLAQMFSAPGISNLAGTIGNPDIKVGIARDWLIQVRLVASQYRWRNRLSATQQLRLYAPAWLRDAVAADLTLQMPGDNSLSTSYAEVDGYLDDINVDVVWYIDDVPTMAAGTLPAGPQGATTAASNFDSYLGFAATAEWLLTAPGVFTRLDGGSVDLGVVRTKEDVQKNRFCEFAETFETVAYMGPQTAANAWGVRGSTPVNIIGAHALGIATAAGVAVE